MEYDHNSYTFTYTQSNKTFSIVGLDSFFLRELLQQGINEKTNIKISDDGEIMLEFKPRRTDVYISSSHHEINSIFNFNFSFTGDKLQRDILKIIDLYEKHFDIHFEDDIIEIHTYDDLIRKLKITNKQILKITDPEHTSTLNIKGSINNGEYKKVKLKLTKDKIELSSKNNGILNYVFNRKTFIKKL